MMCLYKYVLFLMEINFRLVKVLVNLNLSNNILKVDIEKYFTRGLNESMKNAIRNV